MPLTKKRLIEWISDFGDIDDIINVVRHTGGNSLALLQKQVSEILDLKQNTDECIRDRAENFNYVLANQLKESDIDALIETLKKTKKEDIIAALMRCWNFDDEKSISEEIDYDMRV